MNVPVRQTCTAAMISLIFGILSFFVLPVVGAVVAVVSGHMARAEIRRSQGALDGDGLAVGGLVLGYIHLAAAIAFTMLFFGAIMAFFAVLIHAGHH